MSALGKTAITSEVINGIVANVDRVDRLTAAGMEQVRSVGCDVQSEAIELSFLTDKGEVRRVRLAHCDARVLLDEIDAQLQSLSQSDKSSGMLSEEGSPQVGHVE